MRIARLTRYSGKPNPDNLNTSYYLSPITRSSPSSP